MEHERLGRTFFHTVYEPDGIKYPDMDFPKKHIMRGLLHFIWNKLGMTIPKLIGLHPSWPNVVHSYLGKYFVIYKGTFLSFRYKTFTNIFFGSSPACKGLKNQSCKTKSEGGLKRTDLVPEYSVSKRKIWSLPLICYFQMRIYSANPPSFPLLPPPYTLVVVLLRMHSSKTMFEGQPKCHGTPLSPGGSTIIPAFFPFLIMLGFLGIRLLFVLICRWSEKSCSNLL